MAYLSATSPWDPPATAVLLQDAPKRTVDDGMYHPYTSVLDNGVYTAASPQTVDPANQVLAQQSAAAVDPQASLGLTQLAPSLQVEQTLQTSPTAPTITISITTSIITSTVTWSSTPSPSTTSSHTTSTETTSAEPSSSLAIVPTTTDRVAPPPASPEIHHHAHPLSSIDQAGIALGIMGAALILVALVFWRLERKKRALRRHALDRNDHDDDPTHRLPPAKSYRVYSLASSLYTRTRSTLTLASVAERFKASGGPLLPSIHSRLSDISSHDEVPAPSPAPLQCHAGQFNPSRVRDLVQRWLSESSSLARRTLDKIRRLRKPRLTPAQRRSRQPYEYGFCEEYLHIPPPEPTRLERTLGRLWATGSSVMLATTKKLPLPYPPRAHLSPQLSEKGLTGSPSTSSRNSEGEHNSHDGICDRHRQQYAQQLGLEANTSFTGEKDPVRVQCVASSLVTVEESRGQNEDAVSARISGDDAKAEHESNPQHAQAQAQAQAQPQSQSLPPSPPVSPTSPTPPSRSPSPPSVSSVSSSSVCSPSSSASPLLPLPIRPKPSHSASLRRLEVPSVITRTFQLYRVEFTFTPRSTGHLEVSEGDTVRLEQNFDNGWALCTLTTTERQGLLPRAYLSTWPIRTGTTNERLEPSPSIANTPTGLERWRSNASRAKTPTPSIMSGNSQPSRFYSRPGTAMSGASGGQDSKAPSMRRTQSLSPTASDASRSS
ncbi:hypothetical protein ASPCAL06046 [Aspergillus calidoustus]|uniref:SH3 domain-containing protein n=1 Tax=Aspergillus calidoustus TaxID=454130 RepID=A0A0U5C865_ASPCI|nr:hypothetical protein ASPCAL06046 [Aspergillus calidoustus]